MFPAEIRYVRNNNEIQDPELLSILGVMDQRVHQPNAQAPFDAGIDPRKYSRIINYCTVKLEKIDVDAFYAWNSRIDFQITTDTIPPSDQQRILQEVNAFQPGWFHADSFYRAMLNYRRYLLIRFRDKDYAVITRFLEKYKTSFRKNETIQNRITELTAKFVLSKTRGSTPRDHQETEWLLSVFRDQSINKKNRYQALVAYNLYHITNRRIEPMLEPMAELEGHFLKGEFYSRRILSNYYANKLLLRNYEGKTERALFCGMQSIKEFTEDYLYYLNNYCSVLMKLDRFDEAMRLSKSAMPHFKTSRDTGRKLIFIANYCRCLNHFGEYRKSVRQGRRMVDELGKEIFQVRWHYFFRTWFAALMHDNLHDVVRRFNKKLRLTERESQDNLPPYIALYVLAASYLEMKTTPDRFSEELESIKQELSKHSDPGLKALYREIENLL